MGNDNTTILPPSLFPLCFPLASYYTMYSITMYYSALSRSCSLSLFLSEIKGTDYARVESKLHTTDQCSWLNLIKWDISPLINFKCIVKDGADNIRFAAWGSPDVSPLPSSLLRWVGNNHPPRSLSFSRGRQIKSPNTLGFFMLRQQRTVFCVFVRLTYSEMAFPRGNYLSQAVFCTVPEWIVMKLHH